METLKEVHVKNRLADTRGSCKRHQGVFTIEVSQDPIVVLAKTFAHVNAVTCVTVSHGDLELDSLDRNTSSFVEWVVGLLNCHELPR